jgi:hypothetical protein
MDKIGLLLAMDGVNVQTPIEDVGGETTVNLD